MFFRPPLSWGKPFIIVWFSLSNTLYTSRKPLQHLLATGVPRCKEPGSAHEHMSTWTHEHLSTWADLQNLQGGAGPPHQTGTRWTEKEIFLCLSAPLVKTPHFGRLLCWMGLARYSRNYSGCQLYKNVFQNFCVLLFWTQNNLFVCFKSCTCLYFIVSLSVLPTSSLMAVPPHPLPPSLLLFPAFKYNIGDISQNFHLKTFKDQ